nr:zinc finger, CCHC-type [Tanacetum cinerariifolium]
MVEEDYAFQYECGVCADYSYARGWRGLILNGISDSLFDIYQNVETSKELWNTLEAKYMAEDASNNKFLVSNFINYKMNDSKAVLEQYNELLEILRRFSQHKMNMDESIHVSCIIGKLPYSWKDFKHTLKHLKEELTLIELGSHLRIEESFKVQNSEKPKGNNVVGPSVVYMVEHNNSFRDCKVGNVGNRANGSSTKGSEYGSFNPLKAFMSTSKLNDSILWHARLGHVHFKRMQDMSKDGLILAIDMDTRKCKTCMLNKITKKPFQNVKRETKVLELIHSDLCDLHATPSLGNKMYFVTFINDASRLYVIEPSDSVGVNSIIESKDAIFDEHMFSSVPRPSQRSLVKGTEDSGGSLVSERVTDEIVQQFEPRLKKSKRHRTLKDFGPEFQLYLIEGTSDKVFDQQSYWFNVEDDPKTFDEAMKSQYVAFWKEAINDEMVSIMGNNTRVLIDLPLGCRPLGCKWIFKRKLEVDETIEKFKARLVIQRFKQKSGIDYFDTYALVARISTIRPLIAMASIHSLIIHQMDVKIAFLNEELEQEVYVNQPLGFIMSGNENKDMGEADVILGIRIKHESNGISISQSRYIKKVIKKFNYSDFTPVSTPLDTCEKLMPNKGLALSQLEYSKVIGCLMYAMTCTKHDIAFVVGKLSRYTSNPETQNWQAIQRVLKYLKKTMDYRLVYFGYPSVLKGYTDASWISNTEDNPSISGWVFLFGGGAIYWASKKQTCITGSTIEVEFVALAAADKEAEWLKNLFLEIPLWVKTIALISIHCDSIATLVKAYSQMYNGKSRHLGVRRSMIRELITNGVVSIEFVRPQQNLADYLTNGLARDLRAEAHVLQLIPRMCLEPAVRRMKLLTSQWKRAKWDNGDYICRGLILNGMSDSLIDIYQNVETSKEIWDTLEAKYMAEDASNFKHTLKHLKEELTLIELGSHLHIKESLRVQDSEKPKGNKDAGPSVVNMVEHNNSFTYNDYKGNRKHHDTRSNLNKKPKVTCWKCRKPGHLKKDCKAAFFVHDDDVAWWVDSRATVHVCKDRCWLNIVSDNIGSAFMSTPKLNYSILWHARLGHIHFKRMQDMSKDGSVPAIDMDTRKCKTCMLNKITKKPFQNVKRETKVLKLIHSDLCDLHATPSLGNKKYLVTFINDASRTNLSKTGQKREACQNREKFKAVAMDKGRKTEENAKRMVKNAYTVKKLFKFKEKKKRKGPEMQFFQSSTTRASSAYLPKLWFYVIEPNDSVVVNSIIESRDAIFDENRFSSVPRPSQRSLLKGTEDSGGTRDEVSDQHSYCFNIEDDPKTFDEAMKSQDVAFWKKAINDEMDSIIGNNTWVLADLPPGCRPLGCKYIFKKKAEVARISTIRLLIAMASIHNLIIHQMDVKTAFLNGELEEEAPKQWHQKFDEVVLSNGYLLNQDDKCVYSKFDASGKEVIICLYVDDVLIFGTDQVQVDLTKEVLSSSFSMKDMGEADVIPGIRIKYESNGIAISQSHYIEKVLKKFNYSDCTLVSTPLYTCKKLMPKKGLAVSQIEYSRVIGCLMYAMTCTRPDIAFVVGKLSRYTSNPRTQHRQAIQRVLKYLKKTMDYRLVYSGYPSVLEGYTDASWISNTKDNLSISGWFLALASAGKEAEWLKNFLFEIPLWVKPVAPISISCDSAATLAKAYSQMYNGKSRHLGVRHNMIRELITNGVVSIEFVRS